MLLRHLSKFDDRSSMTRRVKQGARWVLFYTLQKDAFQNENSFMNLLCANISICLQEWTMPIHNWSLTLSQLAIHFEGRLDGVLDIRKLKLILNFEYPLN